MGKTLVTGATGFTGMHLCQLLVADGEQVVAFVRPSSDKEKLKALGIECRQVDIKDSDSVKDNFYGIDHVYHLASAYRTEHTDRDEFTLVNVEATRNLLEAAKRAKVKRFIHCSTVGVLGEIKHPPANEESPFSPEDHYQESKLEGELLAREFISNGLPGAVVRPVGIYGPGDNRFLKLFRAIDKGFFVMIGSGEVFYHMTYVTDLVEGIVLCGRHSEALGKIFIIAGEQYTTVRELVNLVADVLNKPHPKWRVPFYPVYAASVVCEKVCRPFGIIPPLYPRRVSFFRHHRGFSIDKARRTLGYEPKVGLSEGLTKTASWYREKGLI